LQAIAFHFFFHPFIRVKNAVKLATATALAAFVLGGLATISEMS
jgi:hypothetical protein